MDKSLALIFFIFAGLFCLAGFIFFPVVAVFASTENGAVSGYAWSSQIGWVNFGNNFDTSNANIHITDSILTGYAWNENKGRINLNPTTSGVKNNAEGTLSGYAWCEGTGWINFSGVSISASGRFSGTATGDNSVTINFSCDQCSVQTDWRPASSRGGGGLPSGAYSLPVAPFNILINDGAAYANNPTVLLKIQAGSDVKKMAVSNSAGFENTGQEDFKETKAWMLEQTDGLKTVYIKFYTQYGQPSQTVQDSIVLDTQAPEIKITNIKEKYSPDEEVIFGGTSQAEAQITLFIDDQFSIFKADKEGNWLISLDKMAAGRHLIELTPKDFAGNIGKTITADFLVEQGVIPTPSPTTLPPLLQKIKDSLTPILPEIFKPGELKPAKVITLPKASPVSLKSRWELLPVKEIERFVLSPLPADIRFIAEKFPQVQKTFTEVGVAKITDVSKLKSANLELPGLTQTLGLSGTGVTAGKFAMAKGIPIDKLTSSAKARIPSEIVFAKLGNGLVDLNIALSLNDKGQTEQRISTITGKPLQLIVRVDKPAKRVFGYIVFKSRKPQKTSFQVPLNSLASSFIFSDINVLMPAALANVVSVDGGVIPAFNSVIPSLTGNPDSANTTNVQNLDSRLRGNDNTSGVETRLVLAEFEYTDTGNGVYTATVQAPAVEGEYEVITIVDYQDTVLSPKEIRLITVVDPEGYIYEKEGDKETRIGGAIASLYWLNPETKQYELWPAKDFQQENPQTTDVRGIYSFLVPEGYYYLTVDAPGYLSYDGKPFEVKEGSGVHINVEMKNKFWWLNFFDLKTNLLIAVILLLLYNFYRDRIRSASIIKN